jgi:DNA-binding MarR family transcriptional regulator
VLESGGRRHLARRRMQAMKERMAPTRLRGREAKMSLEQQIRAILARSTPLEERENLRHFLTSLVLIIKEARGERLTEQEKGYPLHPDLPSIMMLLRHPEAVDGLQRRLDIIHRYSVTDAQRIMNLITSSSFYPSGASLSDREIRILLELHRNPGLRQKELAQRISTTPHIIAKELSQLRRNFSFQITRRYDPHKFRLALYQIVFQTKSIRASEKLDQLFRARRPPLVRRLSFDANLRKGFLVYLVPDQPKPHRMFEQRIGELGDEFFEEHRIARWLGLHLSLSFDAYDTSKGRWTLEADAVFEALQNLGERKYNVIPQPRGIYYGAPIPFDRIDYLLAESQLASGEPKDLELKRDMLKRYGFDISLKTVWAREQRLQDCGALYTSVYYDIPHFEEQVMLSVECNSEERETIRLVPSMLPFTYIASTDKGITLIAQRPTLYSGLTGELVRAISRLDGVSDVVAIGLEQTFTTRAGTPIADRWDESHQRWLLEESDL